MEQLEFISKVVPWAVKDWTERRILLPSVKIAQACLETGYGRSVPNNNLFGVKGSGGAHVTQEFINGKWITITAGFQDYDSWEASVYGQSDFLVVNKRYRKLVGSIDAFFVCGELSRAGYATDPLYAGKLISIINRFDLLKYDEKEEDVMQQQPMEMPQWAWEELDKFVGDAFNDGTIESWEWVEKVRNKQISVIDTLYLKIFIDERRRRA